IGMPAPIIGIIPGCIIGICVAGIIGGTLLRPRWWCASGLLRVGSRSSKPRRRRPRAFLRCSGGMASRADGVVATGSASADAVRPRKRCRGPNHDVLSVSVQHEHLALDIGESCLGCDEIDDFPIEETF